MEILTENSGANNEVLDEQPNSPILSGDSLTLAKMDLLASTKYKNGRFKDAAETLQHAYDLRLKLFGADSLETLTTMNNLAAAFGRLNKLTEAEKLLRTVITTRERLLGENNVDTLISVNHLGVILKQLYRLTEAEQYITRAYKGLEAELGALDGLTAEAAYNLAILKVQQGNRLLAHDYFKKAHIGLAAALGVAHEHTLDALHWEIKCNLASKFYNNVDLDLNNTYNTEHNHHIMSLEIYKSHFDWVPSPSCQACLKDYWFLDREHHCRICSRSVCFTCLNKKSLVLEYDTKNPVSICNTCSQQGF